MNRTRCLWTMIVLAALFLFAVNSNTDMLTLMAQQDGNRCRQLLQPGEIPSPALINFDNLPNDTVIDVSYQPAYGIRFESTNTTRATIYGQEPTKAQSRPNVAINNAVSSKTSSKVPMNIFFDTPKTHVGFWIGNGETAKPAGVLTAYDAEGEVICNVRKSRVPEPHTVFIGIHDTLGRMVKVSFDYGKEAVSESIDDLYFAPSTTPPAFDFVGTVKGTVGSFSSFFNIGDPVQGSYAFTIPADHDANPNIGEYRGALLSWTISVGNTLFQLDPELDPERLENFIFVKNDASGDIYQIFADLKSALDVQVAANWFFIDTSGRVFTSDELPLVPPDISKFDGGTVQIFDRKTGVSAVFLQINSLTSSVNPVPEPSSEE